MDVFRAENLSFAYERKPVLSRVSFTVRPGELVCLLGPNGCGKTTLLKLMRGLLVPSSGRLLLAGRDAGSYSRRELARRLASVPQSGQPAFAYTVLAMVLMGRAARGAFFGRPTRRDRDIAREALARFDIADLADVPYTRLSGGQRQRTLLARALAQDTPTIVFDEPTTGLDFGHQARFLAILDALRAAGRTIVMTTHFPDHALWLADRVLMLRDGALVADGAPDTVVTEDSLGRLYDAPISIHTINGALRICVPDGLPRPGRRQPAVSSATFPATPPSPPRSSHERDHR